MTSDLPQIELSENTEYFGNSFDHLSLIEKRLTGSTFEECHFNKCSFQGVDFSKSRFIGCRFETCDLSNTQWRNARMREPSFLCCKLMGVQWVQLTDFINPVFEDCNLTFSNFIGIKLKKSKFVKCNLREVDFSEADLSECDFRESDFLNARFNQTSLLKADFRGAFNYLLNPIENKIKGARFSLPEAQGLLAGLGIVIE